MIERCHRRLKDVFRANTTLDWPDILPWALLQLRTTPVLDDTFSPPQLVMGTQPVTPGTVVRSPDFVPDPQVFGELFNRLSWPAPAPIRWNTSPRPPDIIQRTEFVLVRRNNSRPLQPRYSGPYKVLKWREHTAEILMGKSPKSVHHSHLKPIVVDPTTGQFHFASGQPEEEADIDIED